MDETVSLDSTDEAERLVGWGFKVSLMDIQLAIFLKVHSLNSEREQEMLSLKEGSSFQPLRQVRSSTSQLHQSRERKPVSIYIHSRVSKIGG